MITTNSLNKCECKVASDKSPARSISNSVTSSNLRNINTVTPEQNIANIKIILRLKTTFSILTTELS